MTITRTELRIEGRVQGVFFRQSALAEAQRLGLKGYVRNLPTGEVEAVCEGEAAACEAFTRWCRKGPPAARVDRVEVTERAPSFAFEGFQVEASSA